MSDLDFLALVRAHVVSAESRRRRATADFAWFLFGVIGAVLCVLVCALGVLR